MVDFKMNNSYRPITFILLLIGLWSVNAWSHGLSSKAVAFIISPLDGAQVHNPVTIKFGIKNFKIGPAGQNIHKSGHYHLIIDPVYELSMDAPIPYDKHHKHFDQGETEATFSLPSGRHSLQLVVGDEEHEPFEQLVSKTITIEVLSDQ